MAKTYMEVEPGKSQVKQFWEEHPLGSYEISYPLGTPGYFEGISKVRDTSSRYAMHLYKFRGRAGMKVLDVGCGPGWLTFNYAKGDADIFSLDLTESAIFSTKSWLEFAHLKSHLTLADAEKIPFRDGIFDFVVCDGVLHHTPGTQDGLAEIWRVIKPGGEALVSFYYRNWFLKKSIFPITFLLMKLAKVRLHGMKDLDRISADELARSYDGITNPVGKMYSLKECYRMLESARFVVKGHEVHYFPVRFVGVNLKMPEFLGKFLDRFCGTMIFFQLKKV